jgi:hypothetical protein
LGCADEVGSEDFVDVDESVDFCCVDEDLDLFDED